MRDDRERVLDMFEAIERVEKYAQRGEDGIGRGSLQVAISTEVNTPTYRGRQLLACGMS